MCLSSVTQVGSELAENVIYLGRQGSFTTREGLKIAYLSGVQCGGEEKPKDFHYSPSNLQTLEANLKWDDVRYQGGGCAMKAMYCQRSGKY